MGDGRVARLARGEEIPLHVFVTSPSAALEQAVASSEVTLGIHPNFLPGSTHGDGADEVIAHCRSLVPSATSFRAHTFYENSGILQRLRENGFIVDSNVCLFLQAELVPFVHAAGILRLPVFLEDDSMLRWLDITEALRIVPPLFLTPGLKVINVHPALFAMNAPDLRYYNDHRDAFYGRDAPSGGLSYAGVGVASVIKRIVASIRRRNVRVKSFEDLAISYRDQLETTAGPALARWLTAGSTPELRRADDTRL